MVMTKTMLTITDKFILLMLDVQSSHYNPRVMEGAADEKIIITFTHNTFNLLS